MPGAVKKWIERDRGWKRIKSDLKAASAPRHVAIGIQGSEATASHKGATESGQRKTVAEVGAVHEFGGGRIPQRSFLRATVDKHAARYRKLLKGVGLAVIDGKTDIPTGLGLVGEQAVGDVKQRIADGIPPPNAASTIRRKKSSKPLIHHGQLRNSITKQVR